MERRETTSLRTMSSSSLGQGWGVCGGGPFTELPKGTLSTCPRPGIGPAPRGGECLVPTGRYREQVLGPVHLFPAHKPQAAAIHRARLVDPEGLASLIFCLKNQLSNVSEGLARQLGSLESSPYARCGSIPCQGPYGKQPINAYMEQQNQCFSKTNQ